MDAVLFGELTVVIGTKVQGNMGIAQVMPQVSGNS
jgi:hypothetical protein